jgi:DNA polymerase III alpha subunit
MEGVSANLCEAVAAIAEHGSGSDISIMWARTRPTPEPTTKVSFSRDDGAVLKEVARQFRLHEPRDEYTVVGIVERCTRERKRASGTISIAALIDNRAQIVRVNLFANDYEKAVEAHKKKNAVHITGELRRDGQRWHLYNLRELFVITDGDSEKPRM